MRNLLIVESAGKIKKLKSILGSNWDVKASIGHIRQLANDGDGALGFDLGADTIDDAGATEKVVESTRVLSQAEAERLVEIGRAAPHQVQTIEGKLAPKKPPAPFITSSLQQAAGARLKFSPEHTMSVAQKLYEAGLITYMRTDSVELSQDFCKAAREWLLSHDKDNVPSKVAKQRSSKDAQEAHEAVRPTDITKASSELKQQLSEDEFALYVMIWMRSIASQCKPAQIRKTTIVTQSGEIQWQARGQMLEFAGYAKYWKDISGDAVLPSLQPKQALTAANVSHEQKQTQPPPRYSEPKLVQLMERRGIGRPSTYAPTIAKLKQRNYVELVKSKVQPTTVGLQVDDFLMQALPELIQSEFTAGMETQLDAISKGQKEWQSYLIGWNQSYFVPALSRATQNLPEQDYGSFQGKDLEKSRTKCPTCSKPMSKVPTKKVKKGYFIKCEDGCKDAEGKGLVMFWSERTSEWQLPQQKTEQSSPAKLTKHPCPVCQKPREEYSYSKDGQAKSMLRCSDAAVRTNPKHKDVAYFRGNQRQWWSPKLGNLGA